MDEFVRELQSGINPFGSRRGGADRAVPARCGYGCAVRDQLGGESWKEPIQLRPYRFRKHLGQHLLDNQAVVSLDDHDFFEGVGQRTGSKHTCQTTAENDGPSARWR